MSPHLHHIRRAPVIRLWDQGHPFAELLAREQSDRLAWALMRLPMLHRWVLMHHWGLFGQTRQTEAEIARELGCSQKTISRVDNAARERLRRILTRHQ